MGACLIAWSLSWSFVLIVIEVAVALGLVIFVHELGHFVVAKLCGVKCEKFYLGFDFWGLKLCKFRWGETEYGIGVFPLGGYVKMLGQEDNPAKLREELERAKEQPAGGAEAAVKAAASPRGTNPPAQPPADDSLEHAEQAIYNPRSFLAKSVPQRMAIIAAGVIMNVIFAFLAAIGAYRLGVRQIACGVGAVIPGRPAWQAGVKVGDMFEQINGNPTTRFQDLMVDVSLSSNSGGIPIVIRRPGVAKPFEIRVTPVNAGLSPKIGVAPPRSTQLEKELPAWPGSAAAKAQPELNGLDRVVQIGDRKVESYADIEAALAEAPDKPLTVTVERTVSRSAVTGEKSPIETVSTIVSPNPMWTLGVEMAIGPVAAVQVDSPAAEAGLQPGDVLRAIDGQPVGDPLTLPERLRKRAGETVRLTIERKGQTGPLEFSVKLRAADWFDRSLDKNSPVGVPALGVAYFVTNRIEKIDEKGPAAQSGLQPGSLIKEVTIAPPTEIDEKISKIVQQAPETIALTDKQQNWPFLMSVLQRALPGSRIELKLADDRTVKLDPAPAVDWFNPDRGMVFSDLDFFQVAQTWSEAVRLGGEETWDALTMVVKFIRALGSGRVSLRGTGGPIMIAKVAASAASQGLGELLLFITMISANLAVINILPIPVLDGGLLMFLLWEGIRGKPADERVQLVLTYLGLALIVALMIFVFGLDLGLISREVPPS